MESIELLILHGAARAPARASASDRSPDDGPRYRFTIYEGTLELPEHAALPWSDVRIAVPAGSQDVVAEALALLLTGPLMSCVDTADILFISGARRRTGSQGRAFVSEGVAGARQAADLQTAMAGSRREDYDGSIILMQLVAGEDEELFSLAELDAVASRVIARRDHRDHLLSACLEASRSEMVAIAFEARGRHGGARQTVKSVKREPF